MAPRKPAAAKEEEVIQQDPHVYELTNVEEGHQTLYFIKKQPVEEGSVEMETVQDGTTNEAVIAALVSRLQLLDAMFPSQYNKDAIRHLSEASNSLGERTRERAARGVEGTHQQ